jgi:hypothetical protein
LNNTAYAFGHIWKHIVRGSPTQTRIRNPIYHRIVLCVDWDTWNNRALLSITAIPGESQNCLKQMRMIGDKIGYSKDDTGSNLRNPERSVRVGSENHFSIGTKEYLYYADYSHTDHYKLNGVDLVDRQPIFYTASA